MADETPAPAVTEAAPAAPPSPPTDEAGLLATGKWLKTDRGGFENLQGFFYGVTSVPAGVYRPLDEALALEAKRPK